MESRPTSLRYNDTPDGNWVIDRYAQDDSLIIATGGSGHAYKVSISSIFAQELDTLTKIFQFLPVIGRLVADLIEDKLDTQLRQKFSLTRQILKADLSRSGQPMKLDLKDLYEPKDLL